MDKKVIKILVPCIAGLFGVVLGYGLGYTITSNHFFEKQRKNEQQRKELEFTKEDSIYLLSNVVWKKQELRSELYTMMYDDIQSANIDKLKNHSALNNPYWQEINILLNKLSPYCTEKIQSTLKLMADSSQNRVHLCQLYNDLQKVQNEVIKEISGIDVKLDTSAYGRLRKLEGKDLIYLQNNDVWDIDSIWSQKYINFMLGILYGDIKVFTHSEINNSLWQEMLKYEIKSTRMDDLKDIFLNASNGQNVDINELHALITEKKAVRHKEKKRHSEDPDECRVQSRTIYQD